MESSSSFLVKMAKNETKTRIVYGYPYVFKDSLIQDQMLMIQMPNGWANTSKNTITLIKNIWEDLKKETGKYSVKQAKGDAWFWDDSTLVVTDTETEKNIKYKLQIPIPSKSIFSNFQDNEKGESEWASYWKRRLNIN